MLEDGKIMPDPRAYDETKGEISQIVSYFDSNHSTADLKYIDYEFETSEMSAIFGFDFSYNGSYPKQNTYFLSGDYENYKILEVAGYDYYAEIYPRGDKIEFDSGGKQFAILPEGSGNYNLTISKDNEPIYKISMLDVLMPMFESAADAKDAGEYVFTDETDSVSLKMIILNANYDKGSGGRLYYDIKLLFSMK